MKKGDKVKVMDEGLLMLMKFAPPNSKPINEGYVETVNDDGTIDILFPIGDDDINEHSQLSCYPKEQVFLI